MQDARGFDAAIIPDDVMPMRSSFRPMREASGRRRVGRRGPCGRAGPGCRAAPGRDRLLRPLCCARAGPGLRRDRQRTGPLPLPAYPTRTSGARRSRRRTGRNASLCAYIASIAAFGRSTNTPFASTGARRRASGTPPSAPASRRAIALACAACRSHAPSSSTPSQGAARKRIFEASCPACLRRRANSSASSRSKNRIASPTGKPFLVPPRHSTSTPARQLMSAGAQPSDATALAKRAPSMCTRMRRAWAASHSAAISAGV